MSNRTLIHNAVIVSDGRRFNGYVVIDGETIETVGHGSPTPYYFNNAEAIDARGCLLLPGAIDTHVHFRDPGLTRKASIKTESASAVAGGVTSFLDMPNTSPAATSVSVIEMKKEIAAADSCANYGFFIGATNDNIDEILRADYSSIPGIKLFMGSSTGNMLVDDESTVARLFRDFKGVIAVHAEDEATIRDNRQWLTEELGDRMPVALHSLLRSRAACLKATERAVSLARRYGTRLHVLHISTEEELSLFKPGAVAGKRITAETCPHYLIFDTGHYNLPDGYLIKCNPAVKSRRDRDALRRAVADDTIDIIATDHAPHCLEDKQGSLLEAASGMPGIKFMLPLMLDMTYLSPGVGNPALTIEKVVEKTAHNPATLYGIDRRGFIRPGYFADLVLVAYRPPKTDSEGRVVESTQHLISDDDITSHFDREEYVGCRWSPYKGYPLDHCIVATFVNGHLAFDGEKTISGGARPLSFNNQNRH